MNKLKSRVDNLDYLYINSQLVNKDLTRIKIKLGAR